jgi:hypothetical protein
MNKTSLFLKVLIPSAMFLFSCSTNENCNCLDGNSSSDQNGSGVSSSSTQNGSGGSSSSVRGSSGSTSSSSGNTVVDGPLVRENITLSASKSYADIDVMTVYGVDDAANNLDKIDLIAYCGTIMGCENNSIYSPWVINLFFKPPYDYLGGEYVYMFNIPDNLAAVFKTAETRHEILPSYNSLVSSFKLGEDVEEIPIEEGKVFFVQTPSAANYIVTIKQVGEQSVDLEIMPLIWQ